MSGDWWVGPHPGRLRVVVWNMAHKGSQAWAALDDLDPDICLLNEAVIPVSRKGLWSATGTHGRDGSTNRPWCAAVTTELPFSPITDARPEFHGSVRNVPLECSRPGVWEAASVTTQIGSVNTVALYGLMDELSDASVHRSLSEISPLMDDPRYRNLVIIGGDLNTGTQWQNRSLKRRDRGVLERFEALGLVDCLRLKRPKGRLADCQCTDGEVCEHVRTRKDGGHPNVPYQTDYLFASKKMAGRLVHCETLATDEWFAVSDHAPIVADFELGALQ